MMYWGVRLAVILLAGIALKYAMSWWVLIGMRFKPGHVKAGAEGDIPAGLAPIYIPAVTSLKAMGFQYFSSYDLDTVKAHIDEHHFIQVFFHPMHLVYAHVMPSEEPIDVRPYDITFISYLKNGHIVETVNHRAHIMLPFPDWVSQHDGQHRRLYDHWKAHQTAVSMNPENVDAEQVGVEDYAYVRQQYEDQCLEHLETIGLLKKAEQKGQLKIRPLRGLILLRSVFRGMAESKKRRKKQGGDSSPSRVPALLRERHEKELLDGEIAAFFMHLKKPVTVSSARSKLLLYTFSALGFAVVGSYFWGLAIGFGVLVVVAFHELGHALAMMAFGYKDVKMLFLPGMGAAAIGTKEDATAFEEFIVYLMGPLPGIVLGGVLYAANIFWKVDWIHQVANIALALNYINLLPIVPLDGGRIVQTLFLRRSPYLEVFFYIFSALCLLAAGFFSSDTILLILGVVMTVAIPLRLKKSKLLRRVKKTIHPGQGRDEVACKIFEVMKQGKLAEDAKEVQFNTAKDVFKQVTSPNASWPLMIFGGLLYNGILWSPLILVVGLFVGTLGFDLFNSSKSLGFTEDLVPIELRQEQVAQTTNSVVRWEAWHALADPERYFEVYANKEGYAQDAYDLAKAEFSSDDPKRVKSCLRLVEISTTNRDALLSEAKDLLQDTQRLQSPLMAELLYHEGSFPPVNSSDSSLKAIELLTQSRRMFESEHAEANAVYAKALALLRGHYAQLEREEDGRKVLEALVYNVPYTPMQGFEHVAYISELLTEYMESKNYTKVQQQGLKLTDALTDAAENSGANFMLPDVYALLAYSHIMKNDFRGAKKYLEEALDHLPDGLFLRFTGAQEVMAYPLLLDLYHVTSSVNNPEEHADLKKRLRKTTKSVDYDEEISWMIVDDYDENSVTAPWCLRRLEIHKKILSELAVGI